MSAPAQYKKLPNKRLKGQGSFTYITFSIATQFENVATCIHGIFELREKLRSMDC